MPDKKSKKPKKGQKSQKKKKRRSKKRSTKPAVNANAANKNAAGQSGKAAKRSPAPKPKPSPVPATASSKATKKKTSSSKGKGSRSPAAAAAARRSKTKSKPKTAKGRSLPPPKIKQRSSKSLSKGATSVRKENKLAVGMMACKEKESQPPPRLPEEQIETIMIAPDDYLPIYSYKAQPKRTTTPKTAAKLNMSPVASKREQPTAPERGKSNESRIAPSPPAEVRYTAVSNSRHASNRSRKANEEGKTEVEESGAEDGDGDNGSEGDEDEDVVEVNSSDDGED